MTSTSDHDRVTLAAIGPLREAGFALHWIHPRQKRPVGDGWSEAPVASLEQLRATHRPGYNLGVRLGEPSAVAGGFLIAFDFDIRVPEMANEVWAAFRELFPDVTVADLPCVASGSGGESRHLYAITDKPFRSKRLWTSEGRHRDAAGKWHFDAEIEMFAGGKQTVLPPSIHPSTGQPYTWLRSFDFDMLDLGIGPFIPSAAIERLEVVDDAGFAYEDREPLTFKPGQLERLLADVPVSDLHYDDWVRLGQALHHQFGGSQVGLDLWIEHTRRSKKFTGDSQIREMKRIKWRSFGKYRGKAVTLATVSEWAQAARVDAMRDQFDDLDDDEPAAAVLASGASADDYDDILGGGDAPAISDLDLLGGGADADDSIESLLDGNNDWISLLDLNEEGAIKPTLPNVELMLCNDPRLVGLAQINEFTQETVQRLPPGVKSPRRKNPAKPTRQLEGRIWQVTDTLNGELWSDDRDFGIRSILEAPKTQGGYGLKISDRDLKAAIVLAANRSAFHPVREYLNSVTWDGKPRVESLFTTYVGAADDSYTRDVSRLMLVAAVTRIFEPGHKFDFAVILEGMQGKRKSTFIQALGKSWFAELDGDFHDPKQMVELMQGAWIMEIPELSGFNRGDVRSIKAFISRQRDRARLAYARRAGEFPRQCIFIGSTNDREYLKDDTGGRRFWPMLCATPEIDIEHLLQNVDQIWAETLSLYRDMRAAQPYGTLPLFLAREESKIIAARLQESRRVESVDDGNAGRIAEWLSQPINTGSIDDDFDANGKPVYRTETCLVELWVDCFGNELKTYNQAAAQQLGRAMGLVNGWYLCTIGTGRKRFARHGQQRFYSLGGDEGYLLRMGLLPN